ncbi:formate/nitrite transporter family protein [Ekhidna sp.]|uniref:formate/nitrite transporter family protein n=1 Tax=Ekhidna sp. TaxID=2608089 RepID=UPI003BAD7C91
MKKTLEKIRAVLYKPKEVRDVSNEPKTVDEILDEQIKTGLGEYERSNRNLFFSALAAGLEIGFSLYVLAIIYTYLGDGDPISLHFALAIGYPIGFVFVVLGRSELFTEQTTLAVLPVLNGNKTILNLLKLFGIIYFGNLLGGYIIGGLLVFLTPPLEVVDIEAFYHLAHKMIKFDAWIIFGSALLAGWLMGLLSWLVTSAQDTMSRIFIVIMITFVIGLGSLHHSIVGSIEVFAGLITSPKITWTDYFHFQFYTTIGNIVGGVLFVSIIKYASIDSKKSIANSEDRR